MLSFSLLIGFVTMTSGVEQSHNYMPSTILNISVREICWLKYTQYSINIQHIVRLITNKNNIHLEYVYLNFVDNINRYTTYAHY